MFLSEMTTVAMAERRWMLRKGRSPARAIFSWADVWRDSEQKMVSRSFHSHRVECSGCRLHIRDVNPDLECPCNMSPISWSSQVEVAHNPTSKLVACPSPQVAAEVRGRIDAAPVRTPIPRWSMAGQRGASELVYLWSRLEGQETRDGSVQKVLLMICFPLSPADPPSLIAPK
jgi:hypothetical protein